MSARDRYATTKNPPRSIGTLFDAERNLVSPLRGRPSRRKPSPRKLEAHEVIAKLKARAPKEGERG